MYSCVRSHVQKVQRPAPRVNRKRICTVAFALEVSRGGGGVERLRRRRRDRAACRPATATGVPPRTPRRHNRPPRRCGPSWGRRRKRPSSPGRFRPPSSPRAGPRRRRADPPRRSRSDASRPSASAAMARANSPQTPRGRLAESAQRVALRRGWPAAWPLANSSSVSLVLVWPSTLTQLKLWSAARMASGPRSCGRHGGVGEDERQHRRHVRPDHGRPLGHAGKSHVHAVEGDRLRDYLDARVGRNDGMGGGVEADRRRLQLFRRAGGCPVR